MHPSTFWETWMNSIKTTDNWNQSCLLYYQSGGGTGVRAGLSGPQGEVRGHILVMLLAHRGVRGGEAAEEV